MRSMALRVTVAIAAGALWALCFEEHPLSLASWFALAPLLFLLAGPRPVLHTWLHGFVFWLVSIPWIAATLETFGQMPRPLAWLLVVLVAAYLALYQALFAFLAAPLWRRGGWARLALLPAAWVAVEWLRTYLASGFPWNLAAYSWIGVPGALPLAAWIGPYGVSFLVVLTSVGVAMTVETWNWKPLAASLAVPLVLLPLVGRWSGRLAHGESLRSLHAGLPVRIIQPNIPVTPDLDEREVARNYRRLIDLSLASCQPDTLLLWPESAAWPFLFGRDRVLDRDLVQLNAFGCDVLFNSSQEEDGSFYNSAFLMSEGHTVGRYDKRHLVPFGEYVPLRGLFGWMDKLARNAGEYRQAERLTLLPWKGERLGLSICYEVVFPGEVATLARAGATALVTITNDAWYGDSSAPWQHLRAARFRAAENRRPLLRAALTGVSVVVAPDGSIVNQIGVFKDGVISTRLAGETLLTPYVRVPWLVPVVCTLAALWGWWGAWRSLRGRRSRAAESPAPPGAAS